jgi:hypothetical protein
VRRRPLSVSGSTLRHLRRTCRGMPAMPAGQLSSDAALWRDFAIRERIKLNVRGEAFNLLNHARFNPPGVTLSQGTTFGAITTAQDPRILQVAMKMTF